MLSVQFAINSNRKHFRFVYEQVADNRRGGQSWKIHTVKSLDVLPSWNGSLLASVCARALASSRRVGEGGVWKGRGGGGGMWSSIHRAENRSICADSLRCEHLNAASFWFSKFVVVFFRCCVLLLLLFHVILPARSRAKQLLERRASRGRRWWSKCT